MPDTALTPRRLGAAGAILTLLALLILLADTRTPLGFAHGLLYLPLLLLAFALRSHRLLLFLMLLCCAATWVGIPLSAPAPEDFPMRHVYGNRILSTVALVAVYVTARYFLVHRHRWEQDIHSSRQEREYFEALAENMPTQIWAASPDGRLTHVGRRFAEFFGYPRDGDTSNWFRVVHP